VACRTPDAREFWLLASGIRDPGNQAWEALRATAASDPTRHLVGRSLTRRQHSASRGADNLRQIRCHAVVHYRENGAPDVEHDLEELGELHDLIEHGPHWDTIERIRCCVSTSVRQLT
jgi:hypothetical protein